LRHDSGAPPPEKPDRAGARHSANLYGATQSRTNFCCAAHATLPSLPLHHEVVGRRHARNRKRIDIERPALKPLPGIWDTGQKGLALLIGPSSKTFRVQFKLNGKWVQAKIGRFPELVSGDDAHKENAQVTEAHRIAADWRARARQGVHRRPESARRAEKLAEPPAPSGPTYGEVVAKYIEAYAKPRQRTWLQTQRILMRTCRAWLDKPIRDITKTDAYDLLDPFVAAGRDYKAGTLARGQIFGRGRVPPPAPLRRLTALRRRTRRRSSGDQISSPERPWMSSAGHRLRVRNAITKLAQMSTAGTRADSVGVPTGTSAATAERRPLAVMFCGLVGPAGIRLRSDRGRRGDQHRLDA
jgi:hypothetical protein